ncbi:MAG: glycerate kinase [Emcibacter sp.]|nr:glycerate kinase [Emcibacter sp.]
MSFLIDPTAILRTSYKTAVKAAYPVFKSQDFEGLDISGPALVLGAGKAAASMAGAFERSWEGPIRGLVITRKGYKLPTSYIDVREASHPFPDESNIKETACLMQLASSCQHDETIFFLVSGGGSALLCKPIEGLSLEDKRNITSLLMNAGADIRDINGVRRHLSEVKGGGLSLHCAPHKIITYAISDVVGDSPVDIASGPTVEDTTSLQDVRAILQKYQISLDPHIWEALLRSSKEPSYNGKDKGNSYRFIGKPSLSLDAAAKYFKGIGVVPIILGDAIIGEAREVAAEHAQIALNIAEDPNSVKPCVLLSGGETTVTKTGSGKGGPNTEYLASLLMHLKGHLSIYAIAADTDGIDGSEANAGAIISPKSWEYTQKYNVQIRAYLEENNCYELFRKLDDLLITGPTYTNVNDYRAIYIGDDVI